jgi:hypothetical protein
MVHRRPLGVSSRVRRAKGERHPWIAPNGVVVDLPVIVDIIERDHVDGSTIWKVEARVELVDDRPTLFSMHLDSRRPLDTTLLQQRFRWSTPVEIVSLTMPDLIAVGIDPFRYLYPVDGYPDAAAVQRSTPTRLTDEFLTEIAHRYVALGRGYAKVIAQQRNVSVRTVVSWIEKARERGILTATTPGAVGGQVRRGSNAAAPRATRTPGPPARAPR